VYVLQVVSLTFTELSLEAEYSCGYDSVSLYDGSGDNSASLGKFCTVASSMIASSGPSLFVVFETDHSVDTGRFALSWEFHSQGWFSANVR